MEATMIINDYESKIKRVLIGEDEIKRKIAEAGAEISREYAGKPLLVVSVLKGAFIFMADLFRAITIPCEIGFMAASSYCGTESSGCVKLDYDLKYDISEYNVIVVEDIIDTGRTIKLVAEMLEARNPVSLKVYALLDKPERRVVDFKPDCSLFSIPDYFVVGYGMDCDEMYRNLPYIAEYGG